VTKRDGDLRYFWRGWDFGETTVRILPISKDTLPSRAEAYAPTELLVCTGQNYIDKARWGGVRYCRSNCPKGGADWIVSSQDERNDKPTGAEIMNFQVYFNVTTSVSTSVGPLPGVAISWNGDNGNPVNTDQNGNAHCTVTGQTGNLVEFTATKNTYSTQKLSLSLGAQNDANHPLQFQLQGHGWLPCISCFIVSAATGSLDSDEVRRMQEIRARVATVSALSGQLIAEILREYYQFSPDIAADIERDEAARKAVLRIVVRPLMAWYALAVTLGLELPDAKTVDRHVQDVVNACAPPSVSTAAMLEALRSGKSLPADVPREILPFMDRARQAGRSQFASWAIFDPLIRAWSLGERSADVIDEVSEWLGNAPLETLPQPADPDVLDEELKRLSGFFDFRPAARRQVGIRLASAWPGAVPALTRNGFLSQASIAT
jgi:hypothetical protein